MDLSRKRVLVVDDHPGMLSSLRQALSACGINSAHAVRNAREAVQRLRNMRYDVVLADYDLGPGPDGQQLLEHCRGERLLAPTAAFVMVTAERSYDRVMSAAEFVPDDYLVKPFTAETLRLRLTRVLSKKQELAAVYALRAEGRLAELVTACDAAVQADPRHAIEMLRVKGDALLALERHDAARSLFESVLAQRPVPWARLGLARALDGLGARDKARKVLTELLGDAPEYLAAYDALARLHERGANDEDAKAVLRMALEISPRALHRHRSIGEIALRSNDLETAETALNAVVSRSRNAFTRLPDDHLKLSRVLLQREKFSQALEMLSEAKKTFDAVPEVKATAATLESLVYKQAGNSRESRRALEAALEAATAAGSRLSDTAALELARACYANNREHEGAELVRQVVSDNHEDAQVLDEVRRMFGDLDRKDQGESLIERCVNDAVQINNEGVKRARAGDLAGAIELLEEAARTMPGNAHIVMNAAHSLIAHIQVHGPDAEKLARIEEYVARIREKSPNHPKFIQVSGLYEKLVRRTGRKEAA
jgi:DNA-binding response OmpR family regulator